MVDICPIYPFVYKYIKISSNEFVEHKGLNFL